MRGSTSQSRERNVMQKLPGRPQGNTGPCQSHIRPPVLHRKSLLHPVETPAAISTSLSFWAHDETELEILGIGLGGPTAMESWVVTKMVPACESAAIPELLAVVT